jgi:hypothetical protein
VHIIKKYVWLYVLTHKVLCSTTHRLYCTRVCTKINCIPVHVIRINFHSNFIQSLKTFIIQKVSSWSKIHKAFRSKRLFYMFFVMCCTEQNKKKCMHLYSFFCWLFSSAIKRSVLNLHTQNESMTPVQKVSALQLGKQSSVSE